jgi:hypothetical protein
MDQGVRVNSFEGAGGKECLIGAAAAEIAGEQYEHGAEAFSASEQAVFDGGVEWAGPAAAMNAGSQLIFDLLAEAGDVFLEVVSCRRRGHFERPWKERM